MTQKHFVCLFSDRGAWGREGRRIRRVYVYVCARAYDGWRARRWHACATPVVLCGREAKLRGYVIRRVSSERGCRRSSAFSRVRPWRAEETTWYAWHFDVRFSIARASFEINFTRLCYVLANEFVRVAFRDKASSTRREIIINRSFRRNFEVWSARGDMPWGAAIDSPSTLASACVSAVICPGGSRPSRDLSNVSLALVVSCSIYSIYG